MIEQFTGTIGSGKSYHALERIISALDKGLHVISNFPLNFNAAPKLKKNESYKRYMYVPDDYLMGMSGVAFLYNTAKEHFFEKESQCLVVIDEAGNYFPPEDNADPVQRAWKMFMTQSRKMGYDFILVSQTDRQINRTIRACVEYEVVHRKANRVAPFKWLPITVFMYINYWTSGKARKERLGAETAFYFKRIGALYDTHQMFGGFDTDMALVDFGASYDGLQIAFGNCV